MVVVFQLHCAKYLRRLPGGANLSKIFAKQVLATREIVSGCVESLFRHFTMIYADSQH